MKGQYNNVYIPESVRIAFATGRVTLDQSETESIKINLSLSDTIRESSTATIIIGDGGTGSPDDIVCDPAFTDGKLVLNLEPGSTTASFTVSAANTTINNKLIVFKLAAVTGEIIAEKESSMLKLAIVKDLNAVPSISVSVGSLEDFGIVDHSKSSTSQTYSLQGSNLIDNVIVVAPTNFEVSLDNRVFKDSVELNYQKANLESETIYVRFSPSSGKNIVLTGDIRNYSTGATDKIISVSGIESGNKENSLLLNEDFDYGNTSGDITSLSSWKNYSGTANPIEYLNEGLEFPSYENGAGSGAIAFENGSGSREDITRSFNETSTGSVYLEQLVNLSSASASENGDFFVALRDGSGGYYSRLYAKDNGQGKLLFGAAKTRSGSESVMFAPTVFEFNKTYLVIIKYDLDQKSASLFVLDGNVPATEPNPDLVTSTGKDATSLVNIVFRQSSDGIAGRLDGIRVAKTW